MWAMWKLSILCAQPVSHRALVYITLHYWIYTDTNTDTNTNKTWSLKNMMIQSGGQIWFYGKKRSLCRLGIHGFFNFVEISLFISLWKQPKLSLWYILHPSLINILHWTFKQTDRLRWVFVGPCPIVGWWIFPIPIV